MEKIIKEIINKIQEKNERDELKINLPLERDISLRDDLGFDSMDLAELTVNIEDEFDIDIFENGVIDTVGEIKDIISKEG